MVVVISVFGNTSRARMYSIYPDQYPFKAKWCIAIYCLWPSLVLSESIFCCDTRIITMCQCTQLLQESINNS